MVNSQFNKVALVLMLIFLNIAFSQEKVNLKFGKGLINKIAIDSSWAMKMSLRSQFLTTSSWDMDGDNGSS